MENTPFLVSYQLEHYKFYIEAESMKEWYRKLEIASWVFWID